MDLLVENKSNGFAKNSFGNVRDATSGRYLETAWKCMATGWQLCGQSSDSSCFASTSETLAIYALRILRTEAMAVIFRCAWGG